MDKIVPLSQGALTQSAHPSKAEVNRATHIAQKILSAYPDYGKAPPEYLLSVTEFIAYQLPDIQEALAHPTTGVATKCKYLPTIADLRQFIEDRARRLNPPPRTYPLFKRAEGPPMPAPADRKAQVMAALGYDPSKPYQHKQPPLDPGIKDAIENERYSPLMLKSPQGPPSRELLKVLAEQGYPQPVDTREIPTPSPQERAA